MTQEDLTNENTRLREALDEIATNAENLVKGGLPHLTRNDLANAVSNCARFALRGADIARSPVAPLPDAVAAELDPGIRLVVRWLRENDFNTTDSGDGETKADMIAEGDALDLPHVVMTVPPSRLIGEANRLRELLVAGSDLEQESIVEASYNPRDGVATVILYDVTNNDLARAGLTEGGEQ